MIQYILAIVLALVLVACGGNVSDQVKSNWDSGQWDRAIWQ
jgi:Flp pilus assembly pilin Flp